VLFLLEAGVSFTWPRRGPWLPPLAGPSSPARESGVFRVVDHALDAFGGEPLRDVRVHEVLLCQLIVISSNNTRRFVSCQDGPVRLVGGIVVVMTPSRKEPDASRRSERARIAILTATAELIRTVGYDNMSIEAIAAAAGVGKQTIYRWWPSKAAVVLDTWAPEVHPGIEFQDSGDLAADLKAQLKAVIDLGSDPVFGRMFRALVADSQHDGQLAEQLLDRIFRPRIAACKDRLRAAQAAGQLRTDIDLDVAVDLFYGSFYHRYLLRVAPLSHEHADAIIDAALSGIGPPTQTTVAARHRRS
jgi:AcrR family transcriptional regulator